MKYSFTATVMMVLATACKQGATTGAATDRLDISRPTAGPTEAIDIYLEKNIGHTINNNYKQWTQTFTHFDVRQFKLADTIAFEVSDVIRHNSLNDFYSVYRPILFYAPAKKYFLDIYSDQLNLEKHDGVYTAALEVDATVHLYDAGNKTSKRILFLGSTSWIDDVFWLDDTRFVLLGVSEREDVDSQLYSPKIFIGNIKTSSFKVFESDSKNCNKLLETQYQSASLRQLSIKNL